jgi:hypothetical protein
MQKGTHRSKLLNHTSYVMDTHLVTVTTVKSHHRFITSHHIYYIEYCLYNFLFNGHFQRSFSTAFGSSSSSSSSISMIIIVVVVVVELVVVVVE